MREQNSATTMNRREMLKLSAVATLVGTAAFPDKIQATQTVAMKPISLPELPPKASEDLAATLFPGGFRRTVLAAVHSRPRRGDCHTDGTRGGAGESPLGSVQRGFTDQNYTKKQLVEMIQPYAPDAKVEYVRREEDPRDYRVSFARIKERLGLCRTFSISDGIRQVAHLVRSGLIKNLDAPTYRN